jgi:hypothetical protein
MKNIGCGCKLFLCKFVKQKKVDWLSLGKTACAWPKTSASAHSGSSEPFPLLPLRITRLPLLLRLAALPATEACLIAPVLRTCVHIPFSTTSSLSPSLSLYPSLAASPSSSPPLCTSTGTSTLYHPPTLPPTPTPRPPGTLRAGERSIRREI